MTDPKSNGLKKNKEKKLVSVIIPAFNSSKTIKNCINSLIKQTYPSEKYEIIVVDDGSKDNTAEILKTYRIRYYFQKNRGPAAARNKGVEIARGDIVLFTDSDCIPDENWISEMVEPLRSPEIAGVKGVYRTQQTSIWARFAQVEFNERYQIISKHKYIDMIDTYSAAYKKSIFLSLGCFDESFPAPNGEDADLSFRMARRGYKLKFNPKAIVWHTGHPDTLQKYIRLKFWRGYWRVKVYQKSPSKIIKDSYTPQTLKIQIASALLILISLATIPINPSVIKHLTYLGLILFMTASGPFIFFAFKKDILIALLSPGFLIVRALALGFGVLYKLFNPV